MTLSVTEPFRRYDWSAEPTRMNSHRADRERLKAIGNAVIPDVVRLAFMMLFTGCTQPPDELWTAKRLVLRRPVPGVRRKYAHATAPGGYVGGERIFFDIPVDVSEMPDHGLELDPLSYVPDVRHKTDVSNRLPAPRALRVWGTPRSQNTHPSKILTDRSSKDLCTQLRFEKDTPDDMRGGYPRIQWMEWLMGFPEDWTCATTNLRVVG